jgi:hypothetical protein
MAAATKEQISKWFDFAKQSGFAYMIIVCDMFEYTDYPVYVYAGNNLRERANRVIATDMQVIMECYDLSMDKEAQFAERRAQNWGD